MRNVIWLLLLAIVAVVAASLLGSNDNLVTLYWAPWRVDLSFNLFMVILVALCLVLIPCVVRCCFAAERRGWPTTRSKLSVFPK